MVEGYYSDPALRTKVADLRGRLDKTGLANVFTEAVRSKITVMTLPRNA